VEPLGLLVAAIATWSPRWWAHAAGASLSVVVALLVRWPWGPPAGALLTVQVLALVGVGVLLAQELRRRWLRWAGRPSTIALTMLAAGQLAAVLGPWTAPDVWRAWPMSYAATVAIGLALGAAHAAWLADAGASSSSSSEGGGGALLS
jgi:hypothetical protein